MPMRILTLVLCLILAAPAARAADRNRIRTLNIGAQSVVTVVSGLIQGKCRGVRDFLKCLGSGAVAGYGFYEAKVRVADGDVQTGWLLANAAASVSENAAAGRNPVSQFGYSFGPVRIRVPIPGIGPAADSWVLVDVSAYETGKLIQSYQENDRIRWRSGMIAFERDTPYPADDPRDLPFEGRAYGIYPGVWIHAVPEIWNHEVIHAIQDLQGDAAEPSFDILTYQSRPMARKRLIRFERLQVGLLNLANDFANDQQQYEDRWVEIEAYRLANRRAP